jgi:hypothetical protein
VLTDLLVKVSELLPQLLKGGVPLVALLLGLFLWRGCLLAHRAIASARCIVGTSPAGAE